MSFVRRLEAAAVAVLMAAAVVITPAAPLFAGTEDTVDIAFIHDLHSYLGRYYDENKGLYQIHGYIGVKHWYYVLPAIVRHTMMDKKYFKTIGLTKQEYKDAVRYSWRRNYARYLGAYLGGNYHSYSDKRKARLDKKISQQYEQRNR